MHYVGNSGHAKFREDIGVRIFTVNWFRCCPPRVGQLVKTTVTTAGVGLITPGHPRIPQDTPGHPRISQHTPRYPKTHLISYIIHLFIHLFILSDENKAKMASNSFHFQAHSFEKVQLNTADKP